MARVVFPVGSVLDAAIQIEQNWASFYGKAAQYASKEPLREKLIELARAENLHAESFARLKERFMESSGETEQRDADEVAVRYLQIFTESRIVTMTKRTAIDVSDTPGMKDLLNLAIEQERDSILFYIGIKAALIKEADRDAVDAMINEEMTHLVILYLELKDL